MEYVVSSDEFELEFPELSRAGASQFSSWKQTGDFFRCIAFLVQFFLSCFWTRKIKPFKKKKYYSLQRKVKIECQVFWKCKGKKKKNEWQKCQFLAFRAEIKFSSWRKKATSPAKLKILQLELWLEPPWLGFITSKYEK